MNVAVASPESTQVRRFLTLVASRQAVIGIIGLGYVGLPLSLVALRQGFRVIGFDIDPGKVVALNAGRSPLKHIPADEIGVAHAAGRFEATGDFDRLPDVDAIVICVPTPVGPHREPDLSFVENTARAIAARLRRGQLVVLESTSYPGTTGDIVRPILEAGGLKSGEDFFLAFSPEREDPGNAQYSTADIPKIVGGDGAEAHEAACALYKALVKTIVPVSSLETAEAVKITENVFRAINIALVNELKVIYSRIGIDIFEVIDAAKTKPFGYMAFYPGPGLGGHCIPIDPFYLSWKARELGLATRFIELAGEINANMPHFVLAQLAEALDRRFGIALSRAKILIIGVAYKKNVDDMRESPALVIIDLLHARGAEVKYYDPHVAEVPVTREHAALAGMRSVTFDPTIIAGFDATVIVTDHDGIAWADLVAASRLVVDTRNVIARNLGPRPNVIAG